MELMNNRVVGHPGAEVMNVVLVGLYPPRNQRFALGFDFFRMQMVPGAQAAGPAPMGGAVGQVQMAEDSRGPQLPICTCPSSRQPGGAVSSVENYDQIQRRAAVPKRKESNPCWKLKMCLSHPDPRGTCLGASMPMATRRSLPSSAATPRTASAVTRRPRPASSLTGERADTRRTSRRACFDRSSSDESREATWPRS